MKTYLKGFLIAVLVAVTFGLLIAPKQSAEFGDAERTYDERLILYDGWEIVRGEKLGPVELPEFVRPDRTGTLVLRNTLPGVLQQGTYLTLYNTGAFVTVTVGGETVYSSKTESMRNPLPKRNTIRLNPDYARQEITLELSGPDPFSAGMVSEVLLCTYGELMMYSATRASYDRWISIALLFMGLLVLLFSMLTSANRRGITDHYLLSITIALFGVCGLCRIIASDRELRLGYNLVMLSGLVYGMIPSIYCRYCARTLEGRRKRGYRILAEANLAHTLANMLLRVYGPRWMAPYLRIGAIAAFCLVFGFCLYGLLRQEGQRRLNRVLLSASIAALLLGNLIGAFTHLSDEVLRGVHVETLGILVFVVLQTMVGLFSTYDYLERQLSLERELNEGRIKLMINQIKPHFINNVMTVIRSLIQCDPDEADRMVYRFNKYLGYNIDALSSMEVCPFSMELVHIKTYLEIELIHLRPKLRVVYDIPLDDFELPPLSVQPFVENAVKHGIAPKEGVGTLTLSTRETETDYRVIIRDDGVGFDTSQPYDLRGGHGLGMSNARQRLEIMVNGRVEIESTPGEGTTVTVSIPKLREEDFDENDLG